MGEGPLNEAMIRYGLDILGLSILISIITASFVYLSLDALLVKPMTKLTWNIVRFSERPEDPTRIITPSERRDEIGTAERELGVDAGRACRYAVAEEQARGARPRREQDQPRPPQYAVERSAAVGPARGGEGSDRAALRAEADRLARPCHQAVRPHPRFRPGAGDAAPPHALQLAPLVSEVGDALGLPRPKLIGWRLDIEEAIEVDADRDQLFRILANLCRNAVQALESEGGGEGEIVVAARREGAVTIIEVADTGPGVPERARAHLFKAFQSVARKGGTGLGLAIAAELVQAHGGQIELIDNEGGATFRVTIPDVVVALKRRAAALEHAVQSLLVMTTSKYSLGMTSVPSSAVLNSSSRA